MRSINLQMDGNQICATWDDFDCLATPPAGFGDYIGQAVNDLIINSTSTQINDVVCGIEQEPFEKQTLRNCQNCGNKFGEPCRHPCGKPDYTYWLPKEQSE